MNESPKALRLHIGLFGRRNAGKSSLLNALVGQDVAIVSPTPGSTADPVEKTLEMAPLGPVVFLDTAGLDDREASLGAQRVERSLRAIRRVGGCGRRYRRPSDRCGHPLCRGGQQPRSGGCL